MTNFLSSSYRSRFGSSQNLIFPRRFLTNLDTVQRLVSISTSKTATGSWQYCCLYFPMATGSKNWKSEPR